MTGQAIYTQTLTPTQRVSLATRRALAQKIASFAHPDSPIECLSASERSAKPLEPVAESPPVQPSAAPSREPFGSPVNPALSFASFVQGESNLLVLAAAKRAVKSPGEYSPLVLHGGPGFGKTHLLQAIANASNAALYITGDWFNANIVSRRELIVDSSYRIILIDDLQSIRELRARQDLLALMRSIQSRRRQLIVSIDYPRCDVHFDPAIDSRLSGGLILQVPRPDRDLRHGILKATFNRAEIQIPDDCVSYMADHVTGGGRALEGVANRLITHAKLLGTPIDMDLVATAIRDLITPREHRITIEQIQRAVCRSYNVGRMDLLSARRTANIVRPRQLAMFLAKMMTLRSLPEIGRRFGGRDHTTVLHAVRKMEALIGKDKAFETEVDLIKKRIMEVTQ